MDCCRWEARKAPFKNPLPSEPRLNISFKILTHLISVEVRVSDSEMYTNADGRGAVAYRSGDNILTAYYVHQHARHAAGAEGFDPRALISSAVTEIVFYPSFFRRIVREIDRDAKAPPKIIPVPQEDEDEETRKEERIKRLKILPISRFLNLGVDNQVTWPPEETVVSFEGYRCYPHAYDQRPCALD